MTRFIPPILIAAVTAGADAGGQLAEHHTVQIGTTATITLFVGGACLWLANQFARRDKAQARIEERLARIEQKLEDAPWANKASIGKKERR